MESGTKYHRKNSNSLKILTRSIIAQIIMIAVLMNMVLNVEHRQDFGKIRVGLMK